MEHSTPHHDGPGPQEPGSSRLEAGHQLFSWIRSTGIIRAEEGWIGGVMGALSARLGWDAALVRGLGVVSLILFPSPTSLLYGLAWILLPNPRGQIHLQEALRGNWSAGVVGGGLLAVIGGLNVFTPVSLAGPFAILVNLAVIGLVVWAVWALVRRHREGRGERDRDGGSPGGEAAAGKARAGSSSSTTDEQPGAQRADGRPAWFPKERAERSADAGSSAHSGSAAGVPPSAPAAPPAAAPPACGAVAPMTNREGSEQRRRSGLLTLGLVLLAVPVGLGAVWVAAQLGVALFTGLLVVLAGAVVVLALWHIIASARGLTGRGGLLTVAVVLMLTAFAAQSAAGSGGGSHHAFGDYTTDQAQVNTGFANTTVDLRNLEFTAGDALDLSRTDPAEHPQSAGFTHTAEINNAFGNTTVVLPDDVYWEIDPGNFLGNVEIHTQHVHETDSGIGGTSQGHGPEEAAGAVQLQVGNAFGNVTVYDETTYQQEER